MERKLNPFYFPTSVVFVDDDPDFLKSFTLLLDENLPVRTFSSAKKALSFINNQESITDNLKNFTDYALLDNADQKICLNIDVLHQQMYNNERFSQVSIVVADYAMPEMEGLEFLNQIKHPEVKRVLLTGVADEKVAVKAFNDGIIDRFFLKNTEALDKEFNKTIKELQELYFSLLGKPIHRALSDHTGAFLGDSQFQKLFSKLQAKHHWIEYYILEQPQGMILLDSNGETSFLFISSEEESRTHYEMAVAGEAPAELLKSLSEGKHIAWFPTEDGYYEASSATENWQDCLYPTNFFYGTNKNYHCALVTPSPLHIIETEKILPYSDFLKKFDVETT